MTASHDELMPVAVFGCGRMGRLHARVYSEMPGVRLAGVFDADANACDSTHDLYGTPSLKSPDHAVELGIKAATVAVPTIHHLSVAKPLLERGIACLIEKPLAHDVATAREIEKLARDHDTLVQVGHIERFNPAIRALSKLELSPPRYVEVVRISPFPFRSIDVGVVLDVMIHDIDIVLSLAQGKVVDVQAHGVSVVGGGTDRPAEDVCNARITFDNGCVANLTASRLAMKTERRLRLFSPDAYVSLDYHKKTGVAARRTGNVELLRETVEKIRGGEISDLSGLDFKNLVNVEQLTIDDVEPLRAQLDAFIAAVKGETPTPVPASAGAAAVEVAERIVAAMPASELN